LMIISFRGKYLYTIKNYIIYDLTWAHEFSIPLGIHKDRSMIYDR